MAEYRNILNHDFLSNMSSKSQKKFLIIKLSSLGDIVHALPTANTLRQEYPDAFIAWVVEERYQEL